MLKKYAVCPAIFLMFLPISPRDSPPSFINPHTVLLGETRPLTGGPHKAPFTDEEAKSRKVKVIALIDKDLLEIYPGITEEVTEIINFVSKIFKKEFNVVFEIKKIEPWQFPSGKNEVDINEALIDIAIIASNQSRSDDEIFLGFSPKFLFLKICDEIEEKQVCRKEEKTGYAYVPGNTAVITLDLNPKYVALHEIAHLFGAEHTNENSIMNEEVKISIEFDEKNKIIIKKNRIIPFSKIYDP